MPSALFLPGQPGGTAEYRCYIPGRALARAGWDVEFADDLDVTLDGRVRGDPDVLVLSRLMGAYLPDAFRRIRQAGRTLTVFDTDDLFLNVPDWNPASRVPAGMVDAMHATMREADLVTVSTPGLAVAYRHLARRTAVLPNCLDPDLWADVGRWRVPHDRVRVGWLAAWQWRGGDVDVLRPWLPAWLERHPDVDFVALGCPEIAGELGITVLAPPPYVDAMPGKDHLRPFDHVPHMVSTLDVGLAPLADHPFNMHGKSACKGMEYNAAGVPVVASPSQAYRRYVRPGVNGHLVGWNRRWVQALERTIAELDVLRAGAVKVAGEHFVDQHIHLWTRAYEEARRAS